VREASPRVLVAGLGNVLQGDDAFGAEVLRRLSQRPALPRVRLADFGTRGLDLVHALLEGYDLTILVEATSRGGAPGTVYTLVPELPADGRPGGAGASATDVIALAAAVGAEPGRLFVIGCEPARDLPAADPGAVPPGLSPPVARAVDAAVSRVEDLVARWIARGAAAEAVQR
jgi:hydrogenase maturation protease